MSYEQSECRGRIRPGEGASAKSPAAAHQQHCLGKATTAAGSPRNAPPSEGAPPHREGERPPDAAHWYAPAIRQPCRCPAQPVESGVLCRCRLRDTLGAPHREAIAFTMGRSGMTARVPVGFAANQAIAARAASFAPRADFAALQTRSHIAA
jgi:hypothetical protein